MKTAYLTFKNTPEEGISLEGVLKKNILVSPDHQIDLLFKAVKALYFVFKDVEEVQDSKLVVDMYKDGPVGASLSELVNENYNFFKSNPFLNIGEYDSVKKNPFSGFIVRTHLLDTPYVVELHQDVKKSFGKWVPEKMKIENVALRFKGGHYLNVPFSGVYSIKLEPYAYSSVDVRNSTNAGMYIMDAIQLVNRFAHNNISDREIENLNDLGLFNDSSLKLRKEYSRAKLVKNITTKMS